MPTQSRILILHNIPRGPSEGGLGAESEAGVLVEVHEVAEVLRKHNHPFRKAGIHRLEELPAILSRSREPIVFNLVEGLPGHPEHANYIPSICESFGKMTTGCDTPCMVLTQDKWRAKAVLQAAGLSVPVGVVVPVGGLLRADGPFAGPYIVKPCGLDASEGIEGTSIFKEVGPELEETVRRLHRQFGQSVLVEQFVGTREFNVSLFQRDGKVDVLPIAEIDFSRFGPERARIVDYAAKWLPQSFEFLNTQRVLPAVLSEETAREIRSVAENAWETAGCRDYARVDLRMDEKGKIFVLEVNANPDISPEAGFVAALAAGGIPFESFVEGVVASAGRRLGLSLVYADRTPADPGTERIAAPGKERGATTIRRTTVEDRDPILRSITVTHFFRPDEIDVAREVLNEALEKGPEGHYQSYTAELDGQPVGWICFGQTPCTVGTYDIYWIAVDPACQSKGIGKRLIRHAEQLITERGGRQSVIETSGGGLYDSTRGFYLKLGYIEQTRLAEFYAPADDKVIYVKRLR